MRGWKGEYWVAGHPRSLRNPNQGTWFSLSSHDFQQHVMNNMFRFERICNYCQGRVDFFFGFCFLSGFGDPGPLLNGDGCIKYPDMSSDLGIFEKLDRKIQNRALGWMSGTRKWLPVTWSGLQKTGNQFFKNVQFNYGGDIFQTMQKIASKMQFDMLPIF